MRGAVEFVVPHAASSLLELTDSEDKEADPTGQWEHRCRFTFNPNFMVIHAFSFSDS